MAELDLKDRRILGELEKESRQTLNQLGRKVGLGKETVYHRMKSLEEQGIILQYLTRVDHFKLGLNLYPIMLRIRNFNKELKQNIANFFNENKKVVWLALCEGAWNFHLTLLAKDMSEVEKFFLSLYEKFGMYIIEKVVYFVNRIDYFNFEYGLNNNRRDFVSFQSSEIQHISDYERKIMAMMATNSRQSIVKMSEQLKVSPKNLANTINHLEKTEIIKYSGLNINYEKLGYQFFKVWFSFNDLSEAHFNKFRDFLAMQPSVVRSTKLSGNFDLAVVFVAKNIEEFRTLLDGINDKFHDKITRRETMVLFVDALMNVMTQL